MVDNAGTLSHSGVLSELAKTRSDDGKELIVRFGRDQLHEGEGQLIHNIRKERDKVASQFFSDHVDVIRVCVHFRPKSVLGEDDLYVQVSETV